MRTLYVIIALVASALIILAVAHMLGLFGVSQLRVRISTTTSLYATGLLDYLVDKYKAIEPGVSIDFLPVGSGQALKLAADREVCAVSVHAPQLEINYIKQGVLEDHRIIAYNYFVIVGPHNDPAEVRDASDAVDAFRKIYEAGEEGKAIFISRGDNSGTNVKELSIWSAAGLNPSSRPWYKEVGKGMADTLVMADEMRAYTLSDIGTYLKLKKDGVLKNIELLYSNSTELINIYSTYLVSSCTGAEKRQAQAFIDFVYTHQELIGRYGVDKYGQPLFYPAKGHEQELQKIWEAIAGAKG
jgi:tungstate transport system substrate-binding protein